jgi:uncharacterized protein YdaU (DUF1376 family)
MTWAAALQAAHIHEYLSETYDLDARQHGAYWLLMMRYLLQGPLPTDERRLAEIARVTRGVWEKQIWPVLQEFFTPGDDGRIHHEELDRHLAQTGESKRSAAARTAARARWAREAEAKQKKDAQRNGAESDPTHAPTHAATHADAYADASESHTEKPAISMPDASESHSKTYAFASPDASSASMRLRAPPLPLSDSSASESLQNQPESEGERARASASTHAPGDASAYASGHAQPMRPHADASVSHRKPHREAPAPATRIAPDWTPSPQGEAEARKRGYEPGDLAESFRAYYLSTGETRADWDQAFLTWCRREKDFDGARRQGHMTMPIQGGAAASSAAPAAALSEADEALRRRWQAVMETRNQHRTGPIVSAFAKLLADGQYGIDWIAEMETWKRKGFSGETPPEYESYVAARRAEERKAASG